MKAKIESIFILTMILSMTGCADAAFQGHMEQTSGEESTILETASEGFAESDTAEESKSAFQEYSFQWEYQGEETGVTIWLIDCKLEYTSENFRIYSKRMDYNTQKGDSVLRYHGDVLFLQTPQDSMQLLPDQYIIDQDQGSIYVLFEDEKDSFISMYHYWAEEGSEETSISGAKVLTNSLIEEWFSEAHQAEADEAKGTFLNLQVDLNDLTYEQRDVILQGEASGIDKATGEKYYIDWMLNNTTGEEIVTPCILKVYDQEKDREIFDNCAAAFDRIEQGDWSVVSVDRVEPYDKKAYLEAIDVWKWRRVDVNEDGLPELVSVYAYKEDAILPIERIFAYTGGNEGPVELVYSDLNDYSEFLFLGSNGNVIYDYSDHGPMHYGCYPQYVFDVKWHLKKLYELEIYYFYETDYNIAEENDAIYKEIYPDTYGARGGGYYYFQTRPKTVEELRDNEEATYWVKEEITRETFVETYRRMTGFDFFRLNCYDRFV